MSGHPPPDPRFTFAGILGPDGQPFDPASPADAPLCDFCADPSALVAWRYPAADFDLPSPDPSTGLASRGDWAACAPCHGLIVAGSWDALAGRSARCYAVKFETPAADVLPAITLLHLFFRIHRRGPAVPHPAGA